MKTHLYFICLISIALLSCEKFRPKKLLTFKKVTIEEVPKLVKISVIHKTAEFGTDYWNIYYISVIDCQSGKTDKTIELTVSDILNDKGNILEISDHYLTMQTDEFTVIDLKTDKIYKGKEFENFIEANNDFVKHKIGTLSNFNQQFISLTTKQGDAYVLNLKNFKLYPGNTARYWEIPDSLKFFKIERVNLKQAIGLEKSFAIVADNEKGYALKTNPTNQVKSDLCEYSLEKLNYLNSENTKIVSNSVNQTFNYNFKADSKSEKIISEKQYLKASISNLTGSKIYILHNDPSKIPKKLFSCFDIEKQKEIFNIELPEFKKKTIDLYGFIVWNADKKSFFYCKFGTSEPLYEFSAENGNLIAKY